MFLLCVFLGTGCGISTMHKDVAHIFAAIKEKNTFPLFHLLQNRSNYIGFNVNTVDHEGSTILHHYAVYGNKPYLLKILTERKIDFNARNTQGETPFFVAVKNGNLEGGVLLLRFGANPTIVDSRGSNALHLFFQNREIARFLNSTLTDSINQNRGITRIVREYHTFISCASLSTRVPMLKELAVKLIIKKEDTVQAHLVSAIPLDIKDYIIAVICKHNCSFAQKLLKNRKELIFYSGLRAELLNHQALILSQTINSYDQNGNSSLHNAAIQHLRLPLMQSLICCNASALIKNRNGKYPYELLEEKSCTMECRNLHEDLAVLTDELKRPVQLLEYLNNEIKLMTSEQKQ